MTHQISKRILTAEDLQVIGKLLVEILSGEISAETRQAILDLGDPRDIPPPYGHLVTYTQDSTLDNTRLAHALQNELRVICQMLLERQI
jgi:hypothetical protein